MRKSPTPSNLSLPSSHQKPLLSRVKLQRTGIKSPTQWSKSVKTKKPCSVFSNLSSSTSRNARKKRPQRTCPSKKNKTRAAREAKINKKVEKARKEMSPTRMRHLLKAKSRCHVERELRFRRWRRSTQIKTRKRGRCACSYLVRRRPKISMEQWQVLKERHSKPQKRKRR